MFNFLKGAFVSYLCRRGTAWWIKPHALGPFDPLKVAARRERCVVQRACLAMGLPKRVFWVPFFGSRTRTFFWPRAQFVEGEIWRVLDSTPSQVWKHFKTLGGFPGLLTRQKAFDQQAICETCPHDHVCWRSEDTPSSMGFGTKCKRTHGNPNSTSLPSKFATVETWQARTAWDTVSKQAGTRSLLAKQ